MVNGSCFSKIADILFRFSVESSVTSKRDNVLKLVMSSLSLKRFKVSYTVMLKEV